MKTHTLLLYLFTVASLLSCSKTLPGSKQTNKQTMDIKAEGLYAKMETSKGDMLIKFYEEEAPITVANFVGLAEGVKANDAKGANEPYYDGLVFHRVIKDFMIQGGDPAGTGAGGPGYNFTDELVGNPMKHSKKGVLSMANAGPNTNGSQFFIIHKETPFLDGKHTVFGEVIEGLDVLDAIATTAVGAEDRPKEEVKILHVTIIKNGKYKNYNANASFDQGVKNLEAKLANVNADQKANEKAAMDDLSKGMDKTATGLMYKITQEGTGDKPSVGQTVSVHYTGKLLDGTVFDSSYKRGDPLDFPIGKGQVIAGWDEGILLLSKGGKATLVIPSDLAYGSQGAGGVIPPNATLVFEVELVDFK